MGTELRVEPMDLPVIKEIPDVFTFMDGRKVASKEDWSDRLAEIKDLYEYYMYGPLPDTSAEKVSYTIGEWQDIDEDVKQFDLSNIKTCCIAGEPLNPQVFNDWYDLTGLKLREGFGQSEGSVLIANFKWLEPSAGSTGMPAPLYDIKLINENGDECAPDEEGTIVVMDVKGNPPVGLFTGYYLNPELTKTALHGEYYDTGDVAVRDKNGYYWFMGRNDDVIKCSGYRIGPFEVESAILEHPAAVECAVTSAPDPIRGQVVKATIVLAKGVEPTDELTKEIQEHVKKVTAPYKYPRIVEYVDELPKTISGKIKRKEICQRDHEKVK